jgi:hypothetical protein
MDDGLGRCTQLLSPAFGDEEHRAGDEFPRQGCITTMPGLSNQGARQHGPNRHPAGRRLDEHRCMYARWESVPHS